MEMDKPHTAEAFRRDMPDSIEGNPQGSRRVGSLKEPWRRSEAKRRAPNRTLHHKELKKFKTNYFSSDYYFYAQKVSLCTL